jgi:hypothetical protein
MFKKGQGYFGADDKLTTVGANNEIIQPNKPAGWTADFVATKLSFKPYIDCHIKINGGDPIFWEANTVLNIDYADKEISTLTIVEAGIVYWYFFGY